MLGVVMFDHLDAVHGRRSPNDFGAGRRGTLRRSAGVILRQTNRSRPDDLPRPVAGRVPK